MKYPDGQSVKIGDLIWWDEGTAIGRVARIIDAESQLKEWGLEEYGIFISCDPDSNELSCDVFHPYRLFEDEGIEIKN